MIQATSPLQIKPEMKQGNLFYCSVDTKLAEILFLAVEFIGRNPEILTMIEQDQNALGLKKKKNRLRDKRYQEEKNEKLPGLEIPETSLGNDSEELEQGHPRMPSFQVFIFMILRGYFGSIKASVAYERMIDSMTLHDFFLDHNLSMPSANAILDNLNSLSSETYTAIHKAQLAMIMVMDLDDFCRVYIDSTTVEANSAWPTDSRILLKLIRRIFKLGQKLSTFGLSNFSRHWVPFWLSALGELNFAIDNLGGKRGSRRKRKSLYRKFLDKAEKALEYLYGELEHAKDAFSALDLMPSKADQLREILDHIETDIIDGLHVVYYASARVLNDIKIGSDDKILSIRDRSAAIIVKGGREPKLGYRVQLVRSENGFISGIDVPEGNVPDVNELLPTVLECIFRSTVVPNLVSTDDGYSSTSNYKALKDLGIRYVSMNGSKGKKITDEDLWDSDFLKDARRNRSSIEGLIGTLKNRYEFGQLRRWGLKAVRSELIETVITYNFCRMAELGVKDSIKKLQRAA